MAPSSEVLLGDCGDEFTRSNPDGGGEKKIGVADNWLSDLSISIYGRPHSIRVDDKDSPISLTSSYVLRFRGLEFLDYNFWIGINYSDRWSRRELRKLEVITNFPAWKSHSAVVNQIASLSYHITKTKDSPAATYVTILGHTYFSRRSLTGYIQSMDAKSACYTLLVAWFFDFFKLTALSIHICYIKIRIRHITTKWLPTLVHFEISGRYAPGRRAEDRHLITTKMGRN